MVHVTNTWSKVVRWGSLMDWQTGVSEGCVLRMRVCGSVNIFYYPREEFNSKVLRETKCFWIKLRTKISEKSGLFGINKP